MHKSRPNDLIVQHPLGIFYLFYFTPVFHFSDKNPVYRDRTHVPTCQKVTRLPLSYRGDRLLHGLCVCVCVFFPFILDIKFVGCTNRGHTGGRSHRISHPLSFCGACLYFPLEKDSAIPFPRRPLGRILCTNDLIVLHPLGILFLFFSFLVRKNPFAGIELMSQRVRGLRGTSELPGQPGKICIANPRRAVSES